MKIMKYAFIISLLFLLGCNNANYTTVPNFDERPTIISHAKEPKLSFITNSIVSTIDTNFIITDIAQIEDYTYVVSSIYEQELYIIDLRNNELRPLISLNEGMSKIHYKDSLLYVVNSLKNVVHIIDTRINEHIKDIPVDQYPIDIVVSEERGYVLNSKSHSITVFDINNNNVIHSFPVVERPAGMIISEGAIIIGGHGAVGHLNDEIYVYDVKSGELMQTLMVGLMPIAFSKNNSSEHLFVLCHGSNEVVKLDAKTFEEESRLSVGNNPNYITEFKDNLYITSLDGNELTVVKQENFKELKNIEVNFGPMVVIPGEEL